MENFAFISRRYVRVIFVIADVALIDREWRLQQDSQRLILLILLCDNNPVASFTKWRPQVSKNSQDKYASRKASSHTLCVVAAGIEGL